MKMTASLKYICVPVKSDSLAMSRQPFSGPGSECAHGMESASLGICDLSSSRFSADAACRATRTEARPVSAGEEQPRESHTTQERLPLPTTHTAGAHLHPRSLLHPYARLHLALLGVLALQRRLHLRLRHQRCAELAPVASQL
jgi:hypothetical protein